MSGDIRAAEENNIAYQDGPYTRERLIAICEAAVVPVNKWGNRDSPGAHEKVGLCWVMLKADCPFHVCDDGTGQDCNTNDHTIWLELRWPSFSDIECGESWASNSDTFYLPTPKRLRERMGRDWY